MGIFELFLLAVGLSMDAFAVSICKGLATESMRPRHMVIVGLWFGGFQALMPLVGYFLGAAFQKYITAVDHWVAFVLLVLIGGNMIRESFSCEAEHADGSLSPAVMAPMAVATCVSLGWDPTAAASAIAVQRLHATTPFHASARRCDVPPAYHHHGPARPLRHDVCPPSSELLQLLSLSSSRP